jgi:hypothetical protein
MFARYYSAGLSRFVSVDPDATSATLENPQSWNRYAYALNNPLRYIDPDGEKVIVPVEFSSIVSRGMEDSRTFRKWFNKVDQNTQVTARLHYIHSSQLPPGTQAQTEITPHKVQEVNPVSGQVTEFKTYDAQVNIPEDARAIDQAALIAHELFAVHEQFMGKSHDEAKADKVQERVTGQLEKKERQSGPTIRGNPVGHGPSRNKGEPMQQRISGVCTSCM